MFAVGNARSIGSMTFLVSACLLIALMHTLAAPAIAAGELPRYKFAVGQEISYRSDHELPVEADDSDKGQGPTRSVREWAIWVVRQNADSSWRLILRVRMLTIHKDDKGDEQRRTDHTFYAYADVTEDGRIASNSSLTAFFDVRDLFPRLPPDEKSLRDEWAADSTYRGEVRHSNFRTVEKQTPQAGDVEFAEVRTDDLDPIHLAERKNTYCFDWDQGFVRSVAVKSSYGWGGGGQFERTYTLAGVEQADLNWIGKLDRDFEECFAPYSTTFEDAISGIDRDLRSTETGLARIGAAAKAARAGARLPLTQQFLDKEIEGFADFSKAKREEAAKFLAMFDKPAPDWQLQDLEGKHHKLSDYRGKIVVLDFWNRSCGFCIRAFPALAQLAKDFDSKRVAILGMNDDEDIADAQFVHDYCKIPYPTLRAAEIVEKYGVNSWPTVFVIDTVGNVRYVRHGNMTTLREDLTAQVTALVKEAQQP